MSDRREFIKCGAAALATAVVAGNVAAKAEPAAVAEPAVERLGTRSGEVIELVLINHGSIAIRYRGKSFYVDPVEVKGRCSYRDMPKADAIFITHDHFDHLDEPTIAAISTGKTRRFRKEDRVTPMEGVAVSAKPAYNTTPGRGKFHPRGVGRGYLFEIEDRRIYVAGDTEDIPEFAAIANVDVAFFPVNQPYTMTPAQCANAVRTMKPARVIPYHMGNTDLKALEAELKSTGVPFKIYECLR